MPERVIATDGRAESAGFNSPDFRRWRIKAKQGIQIVNVKRNFSIIRYVTVELHGDNSLVNFLSAPGIQEIPAIRQSLARREAHH